MRVSMQEPSQRGKPAMAIQSLLEVLICCSTWIFVWVKVFIFISQGCSQSPFYEHWLIK